MTGEESSEAREAVLRQRAQALARRERQPVVAAEQQLQVIEMSLLPDRYAFALSDVRETARLTQLTALPAVPVFVAGITVFRGRVVTVINLRRYLGLPSPGITQLDRLLILGSGEHELGVLADAIGGVRRLVRSELQAELAGASTRLASLLVGVTNDQLVVLDVGRLLSDKALVVTGESAR